MACGGKFFGEPRHLCNRLKSYRMIDGILRIFAPRKRRMASDKNAWDSQRLEVAKALDDHAPRVQLVRPVFSSYASLTSASVRTRVTGTGPWKVSAWVVP